jgi:putative iron-regulated protein
MSKLLVFERVSALSLCVALSGCTSSGFPQAEIAPVLANYSALLHAGYEDALVDARALDVSVTVLTRSPSASSLEAARMAWVVGRPAYLQTEVGRFYGGPINDPENDLEGQINSWPLDEAYLDYVQGPPPAFETLRGGLINDPATLPTVDLASITALNRVGAEENVIMGYHGIEFLLWGQDLDEAGPGSRPASDFIDAMGNNGARRSAFLRVITAELVDDLGTLEAQWRPGVATNYRASFEQLDQAEGMRRMLVGITRLSGFELGGERLAVALRTAEQEDEHSCFSDTTTQDALFDQLGIQNVYLGRYVRRDGTMIEGASISDMVRARNPDLDTRVRDALQASVDACRAIPAPFDRAIVEPAGRTLVRAAIDRIQEQTTLLEEVATLFGVSVMVEE